MSEQHMIDINIRLYGSLRFYLPDELRGKTRITLSEGASIKDVIAHFEIDDAVVIAINDEQAADMETALADGDTVLLFEAAAGG